jgi:anaerobic magnesium-protoporphyrin IX monomethyl ester cyclase
MRFLFVQKHLYEYLGPMYLSSILKANGHDVDVFVNGEDGDVISYVRRTMPEVICASCITGEHQWFIGLFRRIKETFPKIMTLMGGPHPTYFPEVLQEGGVDFICRGEGERAIVRFAESREGVGIVSESTGIAERGQGGSGEMAPLVEDLDDLPFPDRGLYYEKYAPLRDNPAKHFMTSRGCVYNCSYCYNNSLKRLYRGVRMVRTLSVSRVIEEILAVRASHGLASVRFCDDLFGLDVGWLGEFAREYPRRVNLPYYCFQRASLMDEERARLLKRSGCYLVFFAVETGSYELRRDILKKNITDEQIVECGRLLREHHIEIATFNMVAIPTETVEDAFATIELNRTIKPDYPMATICQPYPGTELETIALERKVLRRRIAVSDFRESTLTKSMLVQKDIDQLQRLHKLFYLAVKAPWAIPLVRKMIRLPLDAIYYYVFLGISALLRYKRMNRLTALQMTREALRLSAFFRR